MKNLLVLVALGLSGVVSANTNDLFVTEKTIRSEEKKTLNVNLKKSSQSEDLVTQGIYCFDKEGNKVECPHIIIITDSGDSQGDV